MKTVKELEQSQVSGFLLSLSLPFFPITEFSLCFFGVPSVAACVDDCRLRRWSLAAVAFFSPPFFRSSRNIIIRPFHSHTPTFHSHPVWWIQRNIKTRNGDDDELRERRVKLLQSVIIRITKCCNFFNSPKTFLRSERIIFLISSGIFPFPFYSVEESIGLESQKKEWKLFNCSKESSLDGVRESESKLA